MMLRSSGLSRRDWLKRVGIWGSLAALSSLVGTPWARDWAHAIGSQAGDFDTQGDPPTPAGKDGR
jgi:hypothetical protein